MKHGGGNNLMVWVGIVWGEGKMDADKYCQILSDGMVESSEKLEKMEKGK